MRLIAHFMAAVMVGAGSAFIPLFLLLALSVSSVGKDDQSFLDFIHVAGGQFSSVVVISFGSLLCTLLIREFSLRLVGRARWWRITGMTFVPFLFGVFGTVLVPGLDFMLVVTEPVAPLAGGAAASAAAVYWTFWDR